MQLPILADRIFNLLSSSYKIKLSDKPEKKASGLKIFKKTGKLLINHPNQENIFFIKRD
ncbi:hypothetical protein GRAQ_00859 [Rahnella aquatilis CIP 78.65 = ATCC 33071]|nr:hypothetical protein GRAQ_00859 [Rahnella aquatilis CIP 78.65 = ATCC 33071]